MGLNNVQACYKHYEKLELEELNNNVNISDEVIEHLRRNFRAILFSKEIVICIAP